MTDTESRTCDCLKIIGIVLCPPFAVVQRDGCGWSLLINFLLCFLFLIPGIIHAIWIYFIRPPLVPA